MPSNPPTNWKQAASQLTRAVRGPRLSQVGFSRRIGYKSNVAADWEGGHRSPTAVELLRVMERVGVNVQAGFEEFHSQSAPALKQGLHCWLSALQGHTKQSHLAKRAGCSRHQVRRWLSGEAKPRLPDFLKLVQALTGRAPDWVAALVPIEEVPALHSSFVAAKAASRLAYDVPWSAGVRVIINTEAYRQHPTDAWLATALSISPDVLHEAINALITAKLVTRRGTQLLPKGGFTANAAATPEDNRRLRAHWVSVANERQNNPRPLDMTSVNLITVSRADLDRVRELQRAYFRELRGLVASSTPEQTAALVLMQVVVFA